MGNEDNEGNEEKKLNTSVIDLGECVDLLKIAYNLDNKTDLIILKYENIVINTSEKSVQYEVFAPNITEKLNLSICIETSVSIEIYVPVQLDEETKKLYEELKEQGYDLFDKNDKFYTDICTPFTSENGTDVSLADRYNTFYAQNQLSCQANCEYSGFDLESNYLKCECSVVDNNEIETEDPEKITSKSIVNSIFKVLKYSNYKVLKCYKLVFKVKSIYLIGSILTLIYFTGYAISFFIFLYRKLLYIKDAIAHLYNKRKGVDKKNEKAFRNSHKNLIEDKRNNKENEIKKNEKKHHKKDDLIERKNKMKSKSHRHKKSKYIHENETHEDFPPKKNQV